MKGSNLGELEELILLTVGILYDNAYGVAIQEEIVARCNRSITISTVHVALQRLEKKGFLDSRLDEATPERGGRRKLLFRITKAGRQALIYTHEMRNSLWKAIPQTAFNYNYETS